MSRPAPALVQLAVTTTFCAVLAGGITKDAGLVSGFGRKVMAGAGGADQKSKISPPALWPACSSMVDPTLK